MRAFSWTSSDAVDPSQLVDAIICQEVTLDRVRVFHKGHRISADDLPGVGASGGDAPSRATGTGGCP